MSESNDYKLLKVQMPVHPDRIDRVENCVVDGMFDINVCIDGVESWVELKSPKEPKRSTTRLFGSNHKVSQAQMNWALRQSQAQGNCFFLIATDKRWMLIGGHWADDINEMTVEQLVQISYWNTLKPIRDKEQWKILRESLKQRPIGTNSIA